LKKKNKIGSAGQLPLLLPCSAQQHARPNNARSLALALARARPNKWPAQPSKTARPRALTLSRSLADTPAPPVIPPLPLSLSLPAARPRRHDDRPATTTPVTRPCPTNLTIMIYTTPRTSSDTRLGCRHPGGSTSPAMAALWPRITALRRHKPVATKLKAWEASAAHRECSGATSRRGEAVEVASHVRRHDGARSPEMKKKMVARELRAELAGARGPTRCAGERRMD
jgi:hypothetical protein